LILVLYDSYIRRKPKPNIDNVLANVIGFTQIGRRSNGRKCHVAYKNKVQSILKVTCFTDVQNLWKRFWSRILGKTNILVVEIKHKNVVRKKQQLLGIFTSKTVLPICVQLSGCTEKLLAGYTTVAGGADTFSQPVLERKMLSLIANAFCYQSASRDRRRRIFISTVGNNINKTIV